jgi:hypothetical protein
MVGQQHHERARDDAKTSNDFARIGAQSAILINGGAATATLALVGSMARESTIAQIVLPLIPIPLVIYATGVFFAAISLLVMSRSIESYMMYWMGTDGQWERWGEKLWWCGLVLIALALLCFLIASIYLAWTISHITWPQSKQT